MYVDASGQTIGELLAANFFIVPSYQRPFSWRSSSQVRDFWNDLVAARETRQPHYYFGSVLFAGERKSGLRRIVIDGQQRLATLVIYLAATRDVLKTDRTLDGEARDRKLRLIETKLAGFDGSSELTRVVLGPHDQSYFEHLVFASQAASSGLGPDPSVVSKGIKNAYVLLKRELTTACDQHGIERVLELLETLLNVFLVVKIESPTTMDAQVVFEAVNDRGLALTPAELV